MIIIDTIGRDQKLPISKTCDDFSVGMLQYCDNESNYDLPEQERMKVTRTHYVIGAIALNYGWIEDILHFEFRAEAEAVAVYNDIIAAEKNGNKVFTFRQEGDAYAEGTEGDGDNSEGGLDREAVDPVRVPEIV